MMKTAMAKIKTDGSCGDVPAHRDCRFPSKVMTHPPSSIFQNTTRLANNSHQPEVEPRYRSPEDATVKRRIIPSWEGWCIARIKQRPNSTALRLFTADILPSPKEASDRVAQRRLATTPYSSV